VRWYNIKLARLRPERDTARGYPSTGLCCSAARMRIFAESGELSLRSAPRDGCPLRDALAGKQQRQCTKLGVTRRIGWERLGHAPSYGANQRFELLSL
jgi:hypothetical protein